MKEFLKEIVAESVREVYGNLPSSFSKAVFEKPKRREFGDFATNTAFVISKDVKEPPPQLALKLAEVLSARREFAKVEVAGGGFINFTLASSLYAELLREVVEKDFYTSNIGKGKAVLLEYVSANPTGPLHLGHGRGAVVGDVLYRILKVTGFKPYREFYINDAGRQVKLLGFSIYLRMKELSGENVKMPEDAYQGEYVKELAMELLEKEPDILSLNESSAVEKCTSYGVERLLQKIKDDLKTLKVEFDNWFSEQSLYESKTVEKTIELLKAKGLVYEREGALWLKTTKFGDDKDRVLRKSNGDYTYFASDIAYHYNKMKRGYEKAINVWGADHHGYIPRIRAVIKALGGEENWLEVVLVQLVKLLRGGKEVKMSKRAGEFITLRELVDEVGTDAVRFFLLLKRHDTPLDFDIDLALSAKAENPVYYVQYAHARLCGIIDKAKEKGYSALSNHLDMLNHEEEKDLITTCYMLRYELQNAALRREPHRLTYYLLELASKFHKFYNKHRVVDRNNKELSCARLYLAEGIRKTLRVGLNILNVTAPRRM